MTTKHIRWLSQQQALRLQQDSPACSKGRGIGWRGSPRRTQTPRACTVPTPWETASSLVDRSESPRACTGPRRSQTGYDKGLKRFTQRRTSIHRLFLTSLVANQSKANLTFHHFKRYFGNEYSCDEVLWWWGTPLMRCLSDELCGWRLLYWEALRFIWGLQTI